MAEDYYATLGIPRDASQADIQKAYRELARKHHPDLNPNDKTAKKKFQKVQAAFDVLNNPEKRKIYDLGGDPLGGGEQGGPGGPQGGYAWGWPPGGGASGPQGDFGGFNPQDIDFSQLFGGSQGFDAESGGGLGDLFGHFRRAGGKFRKPSASSRQGGDLVQEVQVPFITAIGGGEIQLTVQRPGGKSETLAVKIPAGIEDGKKIRVRGHGQPGPRGGKPGDILLTIRIAPHPYFHRRGNQLYVRVPVTLGEAVGGAKVDIPTPKGVVSLSVPPGASSGTKLRMKGHGVAPKNGPPGDLLAEIQVILPKDLSPADRRAIAEIDRRHEYNPRAELRWQ